MSPRSPPPHRGALSVARGVSGAGDWLIHHPSTVDCLTSPENRERILSPLADTGRKRDPVEPRTSPSVSKAQAGPWSRSAAAGAREVFIEQLAISIRRNAGRNQVVQEVLPVLAVKGGEMTV